jgi:hypothetical protein
LSPVFGESSPSEEEEIEEEEDERDEKEKTKNYIWKMESATSAATGAATFRRTKRDEQWSREIMKLTCSQAINSAYFELLEHPAASLVSEDILLKLREGRACAQKLAATSAHASDCPISALVAKPTEGTKEVELLISTGATLKLKFLLSNFLKCLLLGVRTLFSDQVSAETAYLNASEFLTTALNAVGNSAADTAAPDPPFLTVQTLEEIYVEAIGFLSTRNPGSNPKDDLLECEDLDELSKKYARQTILLLLALGCAKDQLSAAAIFQMLLSLVGEIVLAKRLDFDSDSASALKNDSFIASSSSAENEDDMSDEEDD